MAEAISTTDYAKLTLDDAKKLLDSVMTSDEKEAFEQNRKFFLGDHWQDGSGWIGPRPLENEADATAAMELIQGAFVSKNVVRSVTQRHTGGVIGREPGWTIIPRDPEIAAALAGGEEVDDSVEAEIDEINTLLIDWWDSKGVHAHISNVTDAVLYGGRAVFRLHVPAGQLAAPTDAAANDPTRTPTLTVTVTEPAQAINLVWPDVPDAATAAVYVDPNSKRALGLLVEEDESGKAVAELVFLGPASTNAAEAPQTFVRAVSSVASGDAGVPLNLGGRLTMMEISRTALITQQVRESQRALNLALSMLPRNVVTSGFLERIFTNAQLPGRLVEQSDGTTRFVPDDLPMGAGKSTFLYGKETEDEATGKTTLATPGVHIREAADVDPVVSTKRSHYEDILDEVDQLHVLMASDAVASGVSREQARADYEKSLEKTQILVNALGRWILETALAWTEHLTNAAGKWTAKYRIEFRSHIDTGPLSSDEQRINNESVDAGTMSTETAMQRANISDADAELTRINDSPTSMISRVEKQSAIIANLVAAGLDPVTAATIAGMSEEDIGIIKAATIVDDGTDTDRSGDGDDAGAGGDDPAAADANNDDNGDASA